MRYSATHSLPGHYMEMSGQIRAPAALAAGMNVPTYGIESWGYIADLDALGRQNITYPCPDWNTGLSSP